MEKVLIEIIGSQNIDNQFDKTEFKTVGTFEELEEKYVIKYKEEQDAGEEPINVSVVVLKDESSVEMTREGAVVSRLVIERSQRNLCHYGTADGNCKMRNISRAAAKSGFIIIEMPSSSRIKFICAEYSGFLTRAIVCFAPIFLAIRQDKIFFSSEGVVQIIKSQFFISASSNTL